MGDQIGLNQSNGDDDEDGLHEEGNEEGAAPESTHAPHDGGENHGTGEEEHDGDERLEPAPGLAGRLIGCTETEENGVSCSTTTN